VYEIKILPSAQKDLDSLEKNIFERIKTKIIQLKENPRLPGAIKLTAEEGYRIRIGDYRILYRLDDKEQKIYLYRVKHRKEAYR
jgi:mRNA interferase RelE/StbE